MADSSKLRGWKWDHVNQYLEAWSDGANVMRLNPVASTVNFLSMTPAATGTSPEIVGIGSDTNVGLTFDTQAAGEYIFQSGNTDMLNMHDAAAVSHITNSPNYAHRRRTRRSGRS